MYAVTEATRAHTVCSDFNRRNPGQTQTTNPEKNLGLYDVPQEDALKGSPSSMRQPQASQGLTFLIPRVKPSNLPHEDLARSMQGHGAPSYIHTHGLFSSPPPTRTCTAEQAWELPDDSRYPLFTAIQKSPYGTDL